MHEALTWTSQQSSVSSLFGEGRSVGSSFNSLLRYAGSLLFHVDRMISFMDGEKLMVVRLLHMEFDRVLDTPILMRRAIRPSSQGLD